MEVNNRLSGSRAHALVAGIRAARVDHGACNAKPGTLDHRLQ
jgi:hypothetical protein